MTIESTTPEVQPEQSLASVIESTLVKHNFTEAAIAELKKKYLPMKVDLNDKEGYLKIAEGRKLAKKMRTTAIALCKTGREHALAEQAAWIAKEKDVVKRILEVESHLEAQEDIYTAEQDRVKEAARLAQEQREMARTSDLTAMGALYSDGNMALGDVSYPLTLIKSCDDSVFESTILPEFKRVFDQYETERLEKEEADRKEKEEAERIEAERIESERVEREELEMLRKEKAARDEEDRKKKEAEALAEQLRLAKIKDAEIEAKRKEQEKKDAEARAIRDEEIRKQTVAETLRKQEEDRVKAEAVKAEELANASDKVKWGCFILDLQNINQPAVTSRIYNKKLLAALAKIEEIINL